MKTKNKEKGFTLIEILIVVGIIGILSSVILVGLNSSRDRARDSRRVTDLRQIQQGLELFYTKKGAYPDDLDDIVSEGIGVRQIPTDPSTNDPYTYEVCESDQEYWLMAELEAFSENLSRDSITDSVCGNTCNSDESDTPPEFCVAS